MKEVSFEEFTSLAADNLVQSSPAFKKTCSCGSGYNYFTFKDPVLYKNIYYKYVRIYGTKYYLTHSA